MQRLSVQNKSIWTGVIMRVSVSMFLQLKADLVGREGQYEQPRQAFVGASGAAQNRESLVLETPQGPVLARSPAVWALRSSGPGRDLKGGDLVILLAKNPNRVLLAARFDRFATPEEIPLLQAALWPIDGNLYELPYFLKNPVVLVDFRAPDQKLHIPGFRVRNNLSFRRNSPTDLLDEQNAGAFFDVMALLTMDDSPAYRPEEERMEAPDVPEPVVAMVGSGSGSEAHLKKRKI